MKNPLEQGELHFSKGEMDKAEECFLAATKDMATSRLAYNNLGVIAFNKNDPETAVRYFMKSISIDDSQTDAVANLCEILRASGNLSELTELLQSLAKKHPDNREFASWLNEARGGSVTQGGGESLRDQVSEELERGRLLLAEGQLDEAEAVFQSVIEKDPGSKDAYNNLGVIASRKDDNALAMRCFKAALAIDPGYEDALRNLDDLNSGPGSSE